MNKPIWLLAVIVAFNIAKYPEYQPCHKCGRPVFYFNHHFEFNGFLLANEVMLPTGQTPSDGETVPKCQFDGQSINYLTPMKNPRFKP